MSFRGCRSIVALGSVIAALLGLASAKSCPARQVQSIAAEINVAGSGAHLRSAWMLGDSCVSLPRQPASAAAEQAQLRRHFVAVERLLITNTPRALGEALMRLERTRGRALDFDARRRMMSLLYHRRLAHIAHLRAYREAGLFPLNTDQQAARKPIFIDAAGTACAVGHLMICSGWRAPAEAIARANNFVVVPDVHDGPLIAWVLQSGLIQEEAALIQPFYGPPQHPDGLLNQYLQAGATIERGGVRYDNFTFSTVEVGAAALSPAAIQVITDLSDIFYYPVGWGYFHPSGTNFLALHGDLGATTGTQSLLWRLGYDVTPIDPTKGIGAAYLSSNLFHSLTFGGYYSPEPVELFAPDGTPVSASTNFPIPDIYWNGYAEYVSSLSSGIYPLGDLTLGGAQWEDFYPLVGDPGVLYGSHGISFAPVSRLHVETQLLLAGNASSLDIINEFSLVNVPEPEGVVLAGGVAVMTLFWIWTGRPRLARRRLERMRLP